MKRFELTSKNGFHIVFDNRWTFSCQWNQLTFSDEGKTTCEIAAWSPDGEFFKFPDGKNSLGWVSPDELASWMKKISEISITN